MKTNLCESQFGELAAYAAGSASLSAETAAHLRTCALCQKKVAELKAVAAVHMDAAANFPEPNRRLNRRQLERALDDSGEPRRPFAIRWRPILASVITLIVVAAVLFSSREPRKLPALEPIATRELPETVTSAGPVEPTILALRNEVQKGREQILAGMPISSGMQHYRLKDVESELEN
jgi:anti-sigma factor RsiW